MSEELSAYEQARTNAREEYEGKSLRELAEAFKEWEGHREALKAELSKINAVYDVLRLELIPAKMDEDGVDSPAKFTGVGKIVLTGDMYTSVVDKSGLYQWLGDNGFQDIIQPTVNASTLKAFISGRMKGGKEVPDEFVKITPFTRASLTKA